MAEDRFDDDGAPPKPFDEHDREMHELEIEITDADAIGAAGDEGEIQRLEISSLRMQAIQRYLAETMEKSIIPLEPMYLEVAIGLANIFIATSVLWLRECDHPIVFQNNRDVLLEVIGRMSAKVNAIPFAALDETPAPTEMVH